MAELFYFNKADFLVLCKTAGDLLRHSKVSIYIKQIEWAILAAIFSVYSCIDQLVGILKIRIRLLVQSNKFLELDLLLEWLVLTTQCHMIFFVLALTNFRLNIKTFLAEIQQELSLVI